MAIDYLIGFTAKPLDLEPFLSERNYQPKGTQERPSEIVMLTYRFFDAERSKRGVEVVYHDGLEPDDQRHWARIAPQTPVTASARVSTYMRRNRFDDRLQRETAIAIRDRYGALLYDPQIGKLIYDVQTLAGESDLVVYAIDYPSWYASQWNSTSVAIYTGASHQPARIIERPTHWGEQWAWNLHDQGIYFKREEGPR